ncbi:MAG: DHH family phosphoesterase [Bacteroidetes bacterium]|nr:DHH family phosphoesterase [Bacteroidota bacterium]
MSDEIIKLLVPGHKIAITSHFNPDGDAIGSSLGLGLSLRKAGLNASVIVPNEYPEFLHWLPGNESVLIYEKEAEKVKEVLSQADVIFCLDYNSPKRVGGMEDTLRSSRGVKILIDHHLEPDLAFFNHVFSRLETSSTAELVYEFIYNSGLLKEIDHDIAVCFYTGIMTDTGSFSYACNYENTFRIVADLMKWKIDAEKIHRLIYDTFSESRLRLLGFCLREKLTVLQDFATAYMWLTRDELNMFNFQPGDTEGIVNYALSIKGIRFAAMFIERDDKIRISFRSTGDFSVNEFARKHFLGGGHRNAAGGDSYDTMEHTLQRFSDLLQDYIHQLL